MATATQPAQTLQEEICAFRIAPWMRECASARGMTVRLWFLELAFAERAGHRAQQFSATVALKAERAQTIEIAGNDREHTKMRPERVQRLLFLAESEGLSAAALAERMGVSKNTVRRILQRRERRVRNAPRSAHGQRWCDSGGGRQS